MSNDPSKSGFSTDHLKADLKKRSVRGGAVTASAQAIKFLLQTGSTMLLARLLTPVDFGLIAMVAVFTGFVGLFKDLGLSMATVQRLEINHAQVNSLFWINVVFGVILAGLSAALAPVVAWFYDEPKLTLIMLAMAVPFIFTGLGAQHVALLRRQMRYTILAFIQVASIAAGISAALLLAWRGAGYWALVALTAGTELAHLALIWSLSPWRPGRPKFSADTWPLIRFGGNLTAFNIVSYFTRNMDNLLIGAKWGASPLGIYSKAYGLLLLPTSQINAPMGAVAIPALSRLQDNPERYRRYYCRIVQLIAYITMPLVILLAVLAEEVVRIVLGDQWLAAVSIFRVFAVFAVVQSIVVTSGWILISLGQANRMLKWGAFQSVILIIAFVVGLPWGPFGVALAATLCACILTVPTMAYACHKSPVCLGDIWSAAWRPLVFSGLVLFSATGAYELTQSLGLFFRVGCVLAAAGAAALCAFGVWRSLRKDLKEILSLIRR